MLTDMSSANFDWIEIYQRIADKLLSFKNDRAKLISIIQQAFTETGLRQPALSDDENDIPDICPFSFFGLFNKGLTNTNRQKLLSFFLKHFGLNLTSPDSFDGIPVLNPQMSTFYWFSGRGDKDIDNLWDMFEIALNFADNPTAENRTRFCQKYDICQTQKGVKWNLSMGFFWIRPYSYLSLDGRNRWYMETSGDFPSALARQVREKRPTVPDAEEYLQITTDVLQHVQHNNEKYANFAELSYHAWVQSEEANKRLKEKRETRLLSVEDGAYHVDIDISIEEWKAMLQDASIFYPDALSMVLAWYKKPGYQSSSKEVMAETHPGLKGTPYNGIVKSLGKRIIEHLNRFEIKSTDGKGDSYWCIPFEGWYGDNGRFIWKLRDELAEAISQLGLASESEQIGTDLVAAEDTETFEIYTESDFLKDVYLTIEQYQELTAKLKRKKNIILQGAPGVGKTFSAKRLAWAIMGCKDEKRVQMIQFHQSYGYEDFIMGFRPCRDRFELKTGPFYNFCKQAENDLGNDYFFIIDEINRGNLSKIFGELFMLMENEQRGEPLTLLYTGESFSIPKNVHIIGMMNTADRSLAMLDYALRRRFAFFDLAPAFQSEGFKDYQSSIDNSKFDKLISTVERLNEEITKDESLGRGFRIGHSYFCTKEAITDAWLKSVVEYELIPLLEEYWFDSPETVEKWQYSLRACIQ